MGDVIAFPAGQRGQLRPADRAELTRWEAACYGQTQCRVAVHDGPGTNEPDGADLVLVYNETSEWALWGLARQDAAILLWHCGSGADLGRFPTMRDALAALTRHSAAMEHAAGRIPAPTRKRGGESMI